MTAANITKVTVIDSMSMRFRCDKGKVYEFSFAGDIRDIIEDALGNAIVTPRASDCNKEGSFADGSKKETESRAKPSDHQKTKPAPADASPKATIHKEDVMGDLIDFSKYQLTIGSDETDSEFEDSAHSGLDDEEYEADYAYSQKFL